MGLAASQARVFLLTSENNKLELQAMMIEEERLLLAQEEEEIANEYADATSNQYYYVNQTASDGTVKKESLTLENLATSTPGKYYVITDSAGNFLCACYAESTEDGGADAKFTLTSDATSDSGKWYDDIDGASKLETINSNLQSALESGAYRIYTIADETTETTNDASYLKMNNWVEKSVSSLSNVTQGYYTEDDAAAYSKYTTEMARVNRLDTQLENKLNRIETKKSAVETELESAKELISKNTERTFGYFS